MEKRPLADSQSNSNFSRPTSDGNQRRPIHFNSRNTLRDKSGVLSPDAAAPVRITDTRSRSEKSLISSWRTPRRDNNGHLRGRRNNPPRFHIALRLQRSRGAARRGSRWFMAGRVVAERRAAPVSASWGTGGPDDAPLARPAPRSRPAGTLTGHRIARNTAPSRSAKLTVLEAAKFSRDPGHDWN